MLSVTALGSFFSRNPYSFSKTQGVNKKKIDNTFAIQDLCTPSSYKAFALQLVEAS